MAGGITPYARIAQADALAEGLALILVTGPELRARRGLELILSHMDREREALWHRLDRRGPDIAATVAEARTDRPLILVHGLERLVAEARQDIKARLNLLRDTLAHASATVVIWVPRGELLAFQQRCPDLFHWRSLLVELGHDDVPIEPELEAAMAYVQDLLSRLHGMRPSPDLAIEPWVKDRDGTQRPFMDWAARVQRGLLVGPGGGGKNSALVMLARRSADEAWDAFEAGAMATVPLFIRSSEIVRRFDGRAHSPTHAVEVLAEVAGFPAGHADLIARWADSGRLLVLVDRSNRLFGNEELNIEWLEQFCRQAPASRIITTSRTRMQPAPDGFERAEIVLWNQDTFSQYLRRRLPGRAEEVLREVQAQGSPPNAENWLASPFIAELIAFEVERTGRVPTRWELLESSLFADEFSRALGLMAYRWLVLLATLALELMAESRTTFWEDDVSAALARVSASSKGFNYLEQLIDSELKAGMERLGIIHKDPDGTLRFADPAIQELLAARALASKGSRHAAEWLGARIDDPRWREVVAIAWAMLVRHGDPELIWTHLWPSSGLPLCQRLARMSLALDAAAEARLAPEQLARYRGEAARLADSPEAAQCPAERDELQRRLARAPRAP